MMNKMETPNWEFHDEMYDLEHMLRKVRSSAEALGLTETLNAIELMEKYHAGQVRKGAERVPYIVHPLLIACHALALGLTDDQLLSAALLHDVLEDCGVKPEELEVSPEVLEIVKLLTFEGEKGTPDEEAYYEAIKYNKKAAMIKILDRCNNVSHMAFAFGRQAQIRYIDGTEKHVYPLIDYVKHNYSEYYNAVFLLKYQILSVVEGLKRYIQKEN